MSIDLRELSKTLSYVLRHNASSYGISLDKEGWVDIFGLIFQLRQKHVKYMFLQKDHIEDVLKLCNKKRFEIKGNKIRALYGHSQTQSVEKEAKEPPPVLYQGTYPEVADKIMVEGIKPMSRQYVHMSTSVNVARLTALRKTSNPVILRIDSEAACRDGLLFYLGNDDVWLSEYIPVKYITKEI